ncbi:MAG: lysylphosphatidylglycerol synthase transmembrane domain-containing protein [archaeon]
MYKQLLIVLSVVLLAAVVYVSDPAAVYSQIVSSDPAFLLWVFMIPPATALLRTLRWKVLLDPVKRIRFFRIFPVFMAGIAISNLTPAKVGEAAKSLFLKKSEGIRVSTSLSSIIWERVFDLMLLLAFAAPFGAYFVGTLEPGFVFLGRVAILFVVAIVALVMLMMYSERIGYKMLTFVERLPVIKNYVTEEFVKSFYRTARVGKGTLTAAFLISIPIWVLDGAIFYFSFLAVGIHGLGWAFFVGATAFTVLCGLVSFLPGGWGSTEAVFLAIMVVYGITKSSAAAGILLGRGIGMMFYYIVGLLSFLYLSKMKPQ